ncbi:MAG: phosphatidylserine decarboxylase family protein [Nitrospirae bacterium]|nr:MAG: phosphatidylserine decarboxylase family protein [Nitrospirota bacterium]
MKIAQEGYPFIAFFSFLSSLFLGLTAFMLFFFRDPERRIPNVPGAFLSPADGKVIFIGEVEEDKYLKERRKKISVFMSPFDVHINRSPCDGIVVMVKHNTGKFLAAYREGASLENENTEIIIESVQGSILVRQVAGFLARRTVCRVGVGDVLERGERFGMIKFSSRVDIYLPLECEVLVKLGQKVRAGESIIARI